MSKEKHTPDNAVVDLEHARVRLQSRAGKSSPEALADDLERFRTGVPIRARPVGRVERALKWARRRPTAATLVLLGMLAIPLLIAAIAAVGWFGIEEKPESAFESLTQVPAPRAVQDPRKNGYFLLLLQIFRIDKTTK